MKPLFTNTKAEIVRINNQLNLFLRIVRFTTLIYFVAFYGVNVYLNYSRLPFFIVYIVFLTLAIISLIVEIVVSPDKDGDRLERQVVKEKKRSINLVISLIKIITALASIAITGFILFYYHGGDLELVLFILSIVIFFTSVFSTIVMETFRNDFDMLRLSIISDIESSKRLSILFAHDEDIRFSEKEEKILARIKEAGEDYLKENPKQSGIKTIAKVLFKKKKEEKN